MKFPPSILSSPSNERMRRVDPCNDCSLYKPPLFSDCEAEKSLLQERQSRAQAEVVARRGQVDNLSTRLSSLARLHKTLVGNHAHTAASLETVRSQLVAISKLVSGGGTNK